MSKIFLFGYYGFGNLGDELLAEYFLRHLREAFPQVRLVLLTGKRTPEPLCGAIPISRWNLLQMMKMMKPGDLLVGGGGSIFQDITSKRSLLYYLTLLAAARRKKARVMLFGQGFGPLSPAGTALTARALKKTAALSCRDPLSAEFLTRMGIPRESFRLGVDPLWDLPPGGGGTAGENPRSVGVFLRRGGRKRKLELLSALSRELEGRLKLFSLAPEDWEAVQEFHRELGGVPAVYLRSLSQLEKECSGLSLVLGERLHGLLLSARLGIPGIGLGDDPKLTAFCQAMNFPSFYWQEAGLVEKVRGQMAAIFSSYSVVRQELLARGEEMREKAREDRLWFLARIKEAAG